MIRNGNIEYIRVKECLIDDESVDICTPLNVEWSVEISECGDGSIDEDWELIATDEDGEEYELEQSEKDSIIEEIKNTGGLA